MNNYNIKAKYVEVSDLFVDIYKNFNIFSQIENMRKLSKRELYLFLTLAIDKFSDSDVVVINNFLPFKDEAMEIYKINDNCKTENTVLLSLIEETGYEYIETEYIVDSQGNKLPEPLSKNEVRDIKINNIIK